MVVVEEREEPIVLLLGHRVVLVVMALTALNRQPEHRFADRIHAVEHRVHAELLRIHAPFFVKHRMSQEAGCDELILCRIRQEVASELLDQELVIRQIAIERVDHPISIEPHLPRLIFFKSIRVRVTGGIEPMSSPTFSVVRRREKPFDLLFKSIRRGICKKRIDLVRRWRQTD